MDVSAVSGQIQSAFAKPPAEAAENWGPDNDGDADDTALTVKSFSGPPAARPGDQPAARPGQPSGGGTLYL